MSVQVRLAPLSAHSVTVSTPVLSTVRRSSNLRGRTVVSDMQYIALLIAAITIHMSHHHRHHLRYHRAIASVYDAAGGPLACGGNSYGPVVANKTLPCGTWVNMCYKRCVRAEVLDRGPFVPGRDFDLSRRVQSAIGMPFGVYKIRWAVL